jgi:AcrR family transcriptional regulator
MAGSDETRAALIGAGLELFGAKGFDATTTREIAGRAGANIAAIAYHFGGKEGLRLACGAHVADRVAQLLPAAGGAAPPDPAAAAERLEHVIIGAVRFFATDHAAQDMVAFMLREIARDGPVLDAVYGSVIENRHRALCALWGQATGTDPESEATRLAVFALIGQAVYFRIGQPVICRRMGWQAIGPAEADRIAAVLIRNLHAAIDAAREATR